MAILSQIYERLNDTEAFLDVAGPFMLEIIDEGFERGVDPAGDPWEELTRRHLSFKRKRGFQSGTLRMKDVLRDSMRFEKKGQSVFAGPGSGLPYERIHQKGGIINHPLTGIIIMPRRQYVGFGPDHIDRLRALIISHYFEGLG